MILHLCRIVLLALPLAVVLPRLAVAGTLDRIREAGTIVVGVKADYPPYGFRNPEGDIIGIEPDLAADVAKRLGVKLEMVPVQASNRMQFLQQGKIDLLIATMTDRPDRRRIVGIPEPDYYASGTNVLARKAAGLQTWEDLQGRKICGIQGSFYNKRTAREYGATILAFRGTAEALTALKAGRCVGFVYDEAFITSKLNDPDWAEAFGMPLPSIDEEPWGVGVAKGDDAFMDWMSKTIVDWHASGLILELERKWGVPNTAFATAMHGKYKPAGEAAADH